MQKLSHCMTCVSVPVKNHNCWITKINMPMAISKLFILLFLSFSSLLLIICQKAWILDSEWELVIRPLQKNFVNRIPNELSDVLYNTKAFWKREEQTDVGQREREMPVPGDWALTKAWGWLLVFSSPDSQPVQKHMGKACRLGYIICIFGDQKRSVQDRKRGKAGWKLKNKWERQGQLY